MKKVFAIAAATFALTLGAQAQGTLNWITGLGPTDPNASFVVLDITDVANTKVGTDWSAQVLAGPDAGNLAPVGTVRQFGIDPVTGLADANANGIIASAEVISVGTVAGGGTGTYQIAAFLSTFADYNAALAAGGVGTTVFLSDATTLQFGGGNPAVPAPNVDRHANFQVPEPTTAMLGLLGLGGLVAARRRKQA